MLRNTPPTNGKYSPAAREDDENEEDEGDEEDSDEEDEYDEEMLEEEEEYHPRRAVLQSTRVARRS